MAPADLLLRLQVFYKKQVLSALLKIVGATRQIGNPLGLLNNIGDGFSELLHARQEDQSVSAHVARGTCGLLRQALGGVTGGIAGLTDSIGENLAALSGDREFVRQRAGQNARGEDVFDVIYWDFGGRF